MRNRCADSVIVPGVVLLLVLLGAMAEIAADGGQGGGPPRDPLPPADAPAPALTRTPDGQPDLQGIWRTIGGTFMNIQDREFQSLFQRYGTPDPENRGKSLVVDPPDGKIPYQAWAAAKVAVVMANHTDPTVQTLDPNARCFLHGVPRHLNNREFQIFQPAGHVVFLNMAHHTFRDVPLNGGPHIPDSVKLFMGDSRGRWEGNVLVVDVTNNNDQTWFDVVGSFHSDALQVAERFTVVNADTITYEAVITDPKVYTRPWTFAVRFQRDRGYGELWEEACVENNERTLDLMLNR